MTNRQFSFSFSVGIAIAIFGGFILQQAAVGFSLMAIGAAISTLALLTRGVQEKPAGHVASDSSLGQMRTSVTDY